MAKRKLGRGLDILIGNRQAEPSKLPAAGSDKAARAEGRGAVTAESPEAAKSGQAAKPDSAVSDAASSPSPKSESAPSESSGPKPTAAKSPTPATKAKDSVPSAASPSASSGGAGHGASDSSQASSAESPGAEAASGSGDALRLVEIPPFDIEVNPDQPRREFTREELDGLKRSVELEGILQPLLVRRVGKGYQLIAGERRLRASQELMLRTVPARVVEVADGRLLEIALVENIHRADLNPIELAQAYEGLQDRKDWTQDELAKRLGVSRSSVANTLRLLDLNDTMQQSLVRGHISLSHAKVLLSVGDPDARRVLFDRIAEENLSVRDLEDAREESGASSGDESSAASSSRNRKRRDSTKKPYIVSLEEELSEALGLRVRISERKAGKGSMTIDFYSKDDFDKLRRRLRP